MFCLHKYLEKVAFFAIITVQLLTLGHTRVISQCSSETGEFMENTDAACRTQYPWIYCNGADSTYCTSELCLEDNECTSEAVADVPSAPVQPITPPTIIPTPVPVITTTTVAPVPAQPITPPTMAPVPVPAITPTTVAPVPAQPITPPTVAPVPVPAITPTTVAPVPAQPITPPTVAPVPVPAITPAITPPTAIQATTETTAIIREKCKLNENFAVPYFGSCRYFYHCANGYFGIGDCGFYMFFDVNERKCKIRTSTSCQ